MDTKSASSSGDSASNNNRDGSTGSSKPPKKISTMDDLVKLIQEQKPQIRNRFDAVTLVLHLIMKEMFGFRCIGTGDQIDPSANDKLVPDGWNKSSDSYSFSHKHPRSGMTFLLKNLTMGEKLLVNGLAVEDNRVYTIELNVNDYIKKGVPVDDYQNLFMNLDALLNIFKREVVNKLLPSSESESESTPSIPVFTPPSGRGPPLQPDYDPLRVTPPRQPRIPVSPLYEPGGYPFDYPPFGVGDRDLNPTGPGLPGLPRFPGGEGNLIGPNHPGFGPYVTDPYAGTGPFPGRGRGRGGVPRGHPPGARFDHFGPPGFGFEPDNDELPPPGYNNMYL